MEIGPDAVKEDIAGADVLKKADHETNVTLRAEKCKTILGSENIKRGYVCNGSLAAETYVHVEFGGNEATGGLKIPIIKNVAVTDMNSSEKEKMFNMMESVAANPEKNKEGVTLTISKISLSKIMAAK